MNNEIHHTCRCLNRNFTYDEWRDDSRKDNTVLLLVDRRKSKKFWWTHDVSLAYKGSKEDMNKAVKNLTKNNARVISYSEYYKYKSKKL